MGFMVYKVALRQVSVSVFRIICVINNSTHFSYSIAYSPRGRKVDEFESSFHINTAWSHHINKDAFYRDLDMTYSCVGVFVM